MALPPLPTPWNVFNLRASPYWQESLGGSDAVHPLSLFVGRHAELAELEAVLYGAGESSSRQAVAGAPGVGKTTLVKEFKARARERGYFTVDDFVAMLPGDTPDALFGRVLGLVYETILANRPMTAGNTKMQEAQQLVRAGRLTTGVGGGTSVLGVGGSFSTSAALTTPKDIMLDGPRVLRDLMGIVHGAEAYGVLVHVNNLENLSEADAAASASILRALRDPMLMHPRLHVVVVGSTDAVQTVVNTHQHVRQTFSTQVVQPLGIADVHQLLAARYDYGSLDRNAPTVSPVDPTAVGNLYGLYRGDLRGLLKALDDGVRPNIALAMTPPAGAGGPGSHPEGPHPGAAGDGVARALTAAEIRPTLQQRYAAELATLKEKKRVEQLTVWGQRAPAQPQTQEALAQLWKVSQGAVSVALAFLVKEGYVLAPPRQGTGATEYVLSGTSRLIFG